MAIKLVVGLGNPGDKYKDTRHNIGFMVLDELAGRYSLSWKSGFQGEYAVISESWGKAYLLKPATFMNLSGNSVAELSNYFKIDVEDILVVHDELDFQFGHFKIRKGGSDAGHNGVASVTNCTGGGYYRLRMGIAGITRTAMRGHSAAYVLAPFTVTEKAELPEFVTLGADAADCCIKEGAKVAMQRFNTRIPDIKDQ